MLDSTDGAKEYVASNPSRRTQTFPKELRNKNVDLKSFVRRDLASGTETSAVFATGRDSAERKWFRFERGKYVAINVFLVFHILAIACWCVPIDSPLIPLCRNLVRPYFLWSGLFQSWDMFAPVPKAANTYVEAVLVYQDRSRITWTLPRMEQLGLTERYFKERYRKFAENLQREENDDLLPDAARYIARFNSTPQKPVKTVILIQKWSFFVPRPDGSYVPEPWEQHVLLGYGVQPGDLK